MATMYEKGQSKRYSRVSYGMSGGGETKKRTKNDDKSEAAEANPYGSTKALDEATKKMRKGGMAESKKMMRKEVAFMKKKKAPKSMIAHEEKEAKGKGYARGGAPKSRPMPRPGSGFKVKGAFGDKKRTGTPKSRAMPGPMGQNVPRSSIKVKGAFGDTKRTGTPKSRAMPRPGNPGALGQNIPRKQRPGNPGAMGQNVPRSGFKVKGALGAKKPMKSGGNVKGYYKGGSVDGCVTKGRTKGKIK